MKTPKLIPTIRKHNDEQWLISNEYKKRCDGLANRIKELQAENAELRKKPYVGVARWIKLCAKCEAEKEKLQADNAKLEKRMNDHAEMSRRLNKMNVELNNQLTEFRRIANKMVESGKEHLSKSEWEFLNNQFKTQDNE